MCLAECVRSKYRHWLCPCQQLTSFLLSQTSLTTSRPVHLQQNGTCRHQHGSFVTWQVPPVHFTPVDSSAASNCTYNYTTQSLLQLTNYQAVGNMIICIEQTCHIDKLTQQWGQGPSHWDNKLSRNITEHNSVLKLRFNIKNAKCCDSVTRDVIRDSMETMVCPRIMQCIFFQIANVIQKYYIHIIN